MSEKGISEEELSDSETKADLNKLNNGEIKDPTEFVKIEMKIIDEVKKAGTIKHLINLLNHANQALNSSSPQTREAIKTKLLEFINNPNIYCQYAYQRLCWVN